MRTPQAVRRYLTSVARRGGQARAQKLTAERRKAIAKQAARARWERRRDQTSGRTRG